MSDGIPIFGENPEQLDAKLANGSRLALALVDHLAEMGGASKCVIPVLDRGEEMVVIVMPKAEYDATRP